MILARLACAEIESEVTAGPEGNTDDENKRRDEYLQIDLGLTTT